MTLPQWLLHPAALFILLSLPIGLMTIAVTPPLRGPDENAHFLRAYGLWRGDIVPRQADDKGRRGFWLPSRLQAEFAFFEAAREEAEKGVFRYAQVFAGYAARPQAGPRADAAPIFTPYGGSEGYSPISYIPYVAAAAVADLASLDFLAMLYLMRLFGLLAAIVTIAYAIGRTPVLPWGFFAVAMLPSAIYGRAVVSADGAVLATTLVVIALCLSAAAQRRAGVAERAVWMTLCALTKPSQVVFAALEAMTRPARLLRRNWAGAALVMIPGVALAIVWVLAVGGEMAAWRLYEGGTVPAEFQPAWKLKFLLTHPLHFPAILVTSLDYSGELWRQLVGVLGWLDTRLHPLFYPLLTALLVVANLDRLDLPGESRRRVACVAAFTAVAYFLLVFLLLFLTSTTIEDDRIKGVQGRYFLVMVPLVAVFVAALVPRRPSIWAPAIAAILLALLSGVAILEAVLRIDWPVAP